MKQYNVLDQIQVNSPQFSVKEKEIAQYILKNKQTILNINIRDLAHRTNSSTSTITRFCKKIKCASFIEFKIMLNREFNTYKTEQNTLKTVESFYEQVIQSTSSLVELEQMLRVVNFIKGAPKILIFGIGSSGLTALEFKFRLSRMGINADAIVDPHMMLMGGALAKKEDLVICISNSGSTSEVINAAKIASEKQSRIISITNYDHTSLTQISDEVLFTSSTNHFDNEHFINNQLSIHYIMDVLSMMLLEDKQLLANREKTLNVIQTLSRDE